VNGGAGPGDHAAVSLYTGPCGSDASLPLLSGIPGKRAAVSLATFLLLAVVTAGCGPLNDPYAASERGANTYYSTFLEPPKHLDTSICYAADGYAILGLTCEPPLQYHFLKRPYQLIPLTVEEVPKPAYLERDGAVLGGDAPSRAVVRTVYRMRVKPGVFYAPHPCFNPDALKEHEDSYRGIGEYRASATRELEAGDFVRAIKRFADPTLNPNCPILPLMQKYILGLDALAVHLRRDYEAEKERRRKTGGALYNPERDAMENPIVLDLDDHPLEGARAPDRRTLVLAINGKYPQFLYWLAMPFFSPVPAEAIAFYGRGVLARHNLGFNRYPVGTGPFRVSDYNPNRQIVLGRNANYQDRRYPAEGERGDAARGLLTDAGKRLPFLDRIVLRLEKENIPRWVKFQQGYYDASGLPSESFDQAVQFGNEGNVELSSRFRSRGIRMETEVEMTTFYFAFNMLDDVVGGLDEGHRALRRAIAIAMNTEERLQIFNNGLGVPAHCLIPPGIFGYEQGKAGMDQFVYRWDAKAGIPRRRSLDEARRLLLQAGYPGGRDRHGRPLEIRFANSWTTSDSGPLIKWLSQQFESIGLRMVNETTDYNRFQEKARNGNFQLLHWGWLADYPDPENFLFLLHGRQSTVKKGGENHSNYDSPEFNRLFERLETMENTPERLALIRQAKTVAMRDAPMIWGYHPLSIGLFHSWTRNTKPHAVAQNALAYRAVDAVARERFRALENRPVFWPLALVALALGGAGWWAFRLAGRDAN
jgi:oligopeptide transport system substrate-binding protein